MEENDDESTKTTSATFSCPICLETSLLSESFTLPACRHTFCISCLQIYLTIRIEEADVVSIPCPSIGCSARIQLSEIKALTSSDIFSKLEYFMQTRKNRDLRPCPKCGALKVGSRKQKEMVCNECGEKFCFLHGSAHSNSSVSCKQYKRILSKCETKSKRWVKSNTKRCPQCDMDIEKSDLDSCNHMQCRCGCNFCYLCLQLYDQRTCNDFFGHYSRMNPFGCPGFQFNPNASMKKVWAMRVGLLLLSPVILLGVYPAYCIKRRLMERRFRSLEQLFNSTRHMSQNNYLSEADIPLDAAGVLSSSMTSSLSSSNHGNPPNTPLVDLSTNNSNKSLALQQISAAHLAQTHVLPPIRRDSNANSDSHSNSRHD